MGGKHLTPEQIAEIKRLRAEGLSHVDIAAKVGTSKTTVGRITGEFGGGPRPTDGAPGGSGPTPSDSSAGERGPSESEPTGDSILDRLRRAQRSAGPDPAPEAERVQPGPGQPTPEAQDAKLAESLVALSNFINVASCRLYAASKKVRVTPKMMKDWQYTKEEKDFMQGMAPYAVPYVKIILERLPIIMAMGYGAAHIWLTSQRLAGIDELAPMKEPEKREE